MNHTCTACEKPIDAGLAVLRSTDPFAPRPTAFHGHCWDLVRAAREVPVAGERAA